MTAIQLKAKKLTTTTSCNRSAVPQMRGRGMSAIQSVCEQADNKADAVLLGGYKP